MTIPHKILLSGILACGFLGGVAAPAHADTPGNGGYSCGLGSTFAHKFILDSTRPGASEIVFYPPGLCKGNGLP